MLGPLDDDGEHTWAVVLGDGHGTYYEVLDVAGLYLDLNLDLDTADGSLFEAKTFLDSASSVTRPPSLTSSLPGAFLLSRSTSAATMKTSRASAARTSSNLNPSLAGGDDQRTLRSTRNPHEHDQDTTPPLPPLPSTAVGHRPIKPSKSLQLDLERGRPRTRQPVDRSEDQRNHQLRLFDQYLLPEQRPLTARSQHTQMLNPPGVKGPVPNAARYIRVASDGASSPVAMTREDFEALPPTIQRKVSFPQVSSVSSTYLCHVCVVLRTRHTRACPARLHACARLPMEFCNGCSAATVLPPHGSHSLLFLVVAHGWTTEKHELVFPRRTAGIFLPSLDGAKLVLCAR